MLTKLNLGCGPKVFPGYINCDNFSSPDGEIPSDVMKVELNRLPWPFADNYADEVRMDHVLEHLIDTESVLKEVRRIMKPGGLFVGEVPYARSYGATIHWQHCHFWVAQTFGMIARDFDFELIQAKNGRVDAGWKWRIRNWLVPGRLMEMVGHPEAYDVVRFQLRKPL